MIETGKVLQSRYRIDKQIGQGGMGAVYVATDERFGSTVAIKETLFMDDNYRKAIEREARLLNSLKHHALPRVSDHFLEENGQFLVMEYIPGDDLFEMMEARREPFALDDILKWADQLLDALEFLHTQDMPVIHRDIKPQNLKLTSRGQIILLDFGLAKGNPTDAEHNTAAKSIFGYSRNYASLEQIQGTGTDPRSDLYSLAATLYHLLTAVPPEDALTRAMGVLSQRPDPLLPAHRINPEVPKGVAAVLHRAMDLNADGRPGTAAEMRRMLRECDKSIVPGEAETVITPFFDAELLAQETRLMGGATMHDAGARQTDIKTEVLPAYNSEETAVKRGLVDTGEQAGATNYAPAATERGGLGSRRWIGALAAVLLLLVGCSAALYIFKPSVFGGSTSGETPQPPVDMPVVEVNSNTAPQNGETTVTVTDSGGNMMTENKLGPSADKPVETVKGAKTPGAKTKPGKDDPDTVIFDGDEIRSGDTVIKGDRVETPDSVIDENGVHPKLPQRPANPNVRPYISPEELKELTPEQRRKLRIMMQRLPRRPPNAPRPQP